MNSALSKPGTILGILILSGLGLRLALCFVPGYSGDQIPWAVMSRNIVTEGLSHTYALIVREPQLGVYPPLYHFVLGIVGVVYQRFYSPTFVIPSFILSVLLKLPPILGDCVVGLVAYHWVRQQAGEKTALGAVLAYMFNPAIVYTSAYWGMLGDSLYTLCVVLSLMAIGAGRMRWAAIAIVAGASLKPQALAFVPLILWASVKTGTRPKLLWAATAGAVALGVIWAPFIMAGTVTEALTALRQTVGLFPVLSANAHNFWYLFSQGNVWVSDGTPLIGPLTARMIGLGAFSLVYLVALHALSKTTISAPTLIATPAYIGLAFFMLSTEMHENYLFPTVTLLALTFWRSRFLKATLIILTITALANMALHDILLKPYYWLSIPTVARLAILNSGLNAVVVIVWTYVLVRGLRGSRAVQPALAREN